MLTPSMVTGSKGEPEAKIALPWVHRWACSAVHSEREVGFDSGKIIGGLGQLFISVRTSSENEKKVAERPPFLVKKNLSFITIEYSSTS